MIEDDDNAVANPQARARESVLDGIARGSREQHGAENFPVAMRLVPRRERSALLSVYTYARFVDDVGDEAPGDRLALLDLIEQDVRALPTGGAVLAPVCGLAAAVTQFGVPLGPLLDLISANRLDQRVQRYRTFPDLLRYCRLSAAPVGRIVLCLAGVHGREEVAMSDAACAGLQILEHCQDVGEDARGGRIYLPGLDLLAAGVDDAQLLADTTSPALRRVVAVQVERARLLLDQGRPLLARLHGWSRLAVTGYLAGGLATDAALRCAHFEVLSRPVRPSKARTAVAAARLAVTA